MRNAARVLEPRSSHVVRYLIRRQRHGPQSPIMRIDCLQQIPWGQVIKLQLPCLWKTQTSTDLTGTPTAAMIHANTRQKRFHNHAATTWPTAWELAPHVPCLVPPTRIHAVKPPTDMLTVAGLPCCTAMDQYDPGGQESRHFHWFPKLKRELACPQANQNKPNSQWETWKASKVYRYFKCTVCYGNWLNQLFSI